MFFVILFFQWITSTRIHDANPGVTGEFAPKKVAAIMGPSGAGKTTFMNALCGRAYYGTALQGSGFGNFLSLEKGGKMQGISMKRQIGHAALKDVEAEI